jgi:hypothetical protein
VDGWLSKNSFELASEALLLLMSSAFRSIERYFIIKP